MTDDTSIYNSIEVIELITKNNKILLQKATNQLNVTKRTIRKGIEKTKTTR